MRIVGVECNADKYFFGRLLSNKNLIRKERNDFEVIQSIVLRSKGNFCIGIIDIDKNKKIPDNFLSIYNDNNTTIYKCKDKYHFIFAIGPRQFEHWIGEFLKINKIKISEFGFNNFDDFMKTSKSLNPQNDEKFKKVIDKVFEIYTIDNNHILKTKNQLEYIINKKYNFDLEEFLNI